MKNLCILVFFILISSLPFSLKGQAPTDSLHRSIFQMIVEEEIEQLTITADFDSIFTNKKFMGEITASLLLESKEGVVDSLPIKVGPRGAFRRIHCDMPPLRLNFSKDELQQRDLHLDFDKLKLVTPCLNNGTNEQTVLKEFLTYQLYQTLTPNSFKVHLVKVIYIHKNKPKKPISIWAFLIENNKEIAHRIGGELLDSWGLLPKDIHQPTYHQVTIFNYMIGNLDWNLTLQKNLKLVRHPQKGILTIPYDFDMSAMVWPSYARLNSDFGQRYFEQRFCAGTFASEAALNTALQAFAPIKENCTQLIKNHPILSNVNKREMIAYLNSFYTIIGKERRIRNAFHSYIGHDKKVK